MIRALFYLVGGGIVLAGFLTPVVYSFSLWVWPKFPWPFSRVYDRVILASVLILFLFLRHRFTSLRLREYWVAGTWRDRLLSVCSTWLLAALASGALLTVLISDGSLLWRPGGAEIFLRKLPSIVLSSVVSAVLEEVVFRVFLFKALLRHAPPITAAILSSVVYATVHFLSPVKSYSYPGYTVFGGFVYLELVFAKLALPEVGFGIIGLTLVGLTLCYLFYRTNSLYLCIGLHAGWIFTVKAIGTITRVPEGYQFATGTGARYFLVSQPVGWAAIVLVFMVIAGIIALKRRNPRIVASSR